MFVLGGDERTRIRAEDDETSNEWFCVLLGAVASAGII